MFTNRIDAEQRIEDLHEENRVLGVAQARRMRQRTVSQGEWDEKIAVDKQIGANSKEIVELRKTWPRLEVALSTI